VRGDVFVQLDRDDELANGLERFMQLDLAAIDVEALLFESLGDVAGGYGSEQLIAFARLAEELHIEPVKLFGERLGFRLLLGGAAHGGGFHLLDDSLVGDRGFDRELPGQEKIPPVSFGDLDYLAAIAQLGHVFFENDFHFDDSVCEILSLVDGRRSFTRSGVSNPND